MNTKSEKKIKILIIEDSKVTIDILEHLLTKAKFMVFTALTANDGKKILLSEPIDLLLLDINLPDIDGYTLCSEIRTYKKFQLLPIIFLSSVNRETGFLEAISRGGDDFISKPFHPKELIAKIKALARVKTLQDTVIQQNEAYNKELQMAKKVQEELIPLKNFQFRNSKVRTFFKPLGDVGGDFVDAWTSYNNLHLFIADCSGHGPSAALIGAMLKMQLFAIPENLSFKERVKHIRTNLKRVLPEDYSITFFYGIFHEDGSFDYINGGHPYPFLFDGQETSTLKGSGHLIMNIEMNDADSVHKIQLTENSTVLFYTDGVTEAISANSDIFGQERLGEVFRNSVNKELEIAETIIQGIQEYPGEYAFQDDIAMITLEVK